MRVMAVLVAVLADVLADVLAVCSHVVMCGASFPINGAGIQPSYPFLVA